VIRSKNKIILPVVVVTDMANQVLACRLNLKLTVTLT